MEFDARNKTVTIRATVSSFVMLSGIYVVLAIVYLISAIQTPGHGWGKGAMLAGGVAILWWCWLGAFKITITKSILEYRDGLFKTSRIKISEIGKIKFTWIESNILGRRISAPRLLVVSKDRSVVIKINPKPFSQNDLDKVQCLTQEAR